MKDKTLWYQQPAANWNEALPIGNGRLGAMVFGGISTEQIQVNEESVWYGGPTDRNNPSAKEKLQEVQTLIKEGRISEAERLIKVALCGTPQGMRTYQTLGDITLSFVLPTEEVENYERGLDLQQALTYTRFRSDDTRYSRELFMSGVADVCVMHLVAEGKHKIQLQVLQTRRHLYDYARKSGSDSIILGGDLGKDGLDYAMMCKAVTKGGTLEVIGESLCIQDASEVFLYWSAGTTYRMQNLEKEITNLLTQAANTPYEQLKQEHIQDYSAYFNRVKLTLAPEGNGDSSLPTDKRLERIAKGYVDLKLEEMYFDFGRYLLISCSRPQTLPATLQGLWNKDIEAPWGAKYTININTEMNYWPAEVCDLGECHLPLFDQLLKMLPNGKKTARDMYGCRGFVAHHNTDIWGDTAPQDLWIPGSFWVMGAAWLCTHIWTHYQYTQDKAFLEKMYPVIREASLFFLDFCIEYKGYLCTCPSVSPENTFILPNGEQGANSIGVTMDNQILRDLFTQCHKIAEVLGRAGDELDQNIVEACGKLRPTQIGSDGRIMEWCEEYQEKEPGHRHISHLYGLHPSSQITKDKTPELAAAAELTLQKRLASGGGHTGWSRAWIMNHYAKLWDGEKAHENLVQLLIKSTLPNLFDNHPPFQIDGNFGSIAAMAEMLVQSNEDRILLLPALAPAWRDGSAEGIKVVGNAKIRMSWKNHQLEKAEIFSHEDRTYRIKYKEKTLSVDAGKQEWTEIFF